jgi:serine/threonine protein kinase
MAPNIRPTVLPLTLEESNHDEDSLSRRRHMRLLVKRTEAYSRIIKPRHEQSLPQFDPSELILGDLLGTGAFSNVYELSGVDLHDQSDGDDGYNASTGMQLPQLPAGTNEKARQELATRVQDNGNTQYAVKVLKSEGDEDAAADFLIEQKYLAALTIKHPHPNIIRLHGVSSTSSSLDRTDESFLILERVEETLVERMNTWRRKLEAEPDYANDCLLERLDAALQLSSAMTHLHRLGIMYRDLKPNNIGFIGNTLKLLDFGLIKELNTTCNTGMYCTSGIAGSYKYMAPEVLLQRPYSLSADVYAFGMLLWQIMSLEPLLKDITSKRSCLKRVVANHERPLIKTEWPGEIKGLLEQCWTRQANKRSSMKHIYATLTQEVEKIKANLSSAE